MAQPLRDCPPPGWLRDLWSANGLLEGLPCAAGAPRAGAWPANVSFAQIFDNLVPPRALDRYVINLGANDGARHDPAFPLLAERGYGGIMVEGDPPFKERLYRNLQPFNASGRIHVSWGYASPSSIGARLRALGAPNNPDALKIDVDGLDAALLGGILRAGILPKAIVVEVNADLPPPVRLAQAYDDGFVYDFLRKHMRGWLGASADALYTMLDQAGYALVAIELGTREHMVCTAVGRRARMCKKKGTCTHCENNMWFVRADLLKAATGLEPPSWPQFVNAFWKQTFAVNTFTGNSGPFPHQVVQHDGSFSRADEDRPYTPECYNLCEMQYFKARPGETFTKPDCPLQTLRKAVEEAGSAGTGTASIAGGGWRTWAKLSLLLAKPANAVRAAAFAKSTAEAIKAPACRPRETCPYNATATVHARFGHKQHWRGAGASSRRLSAQAARSTRRVLEQADYPGWVKTPGQVRESPAVFVMNPMKADHGHVKLAQNFTSVLGFKAIDPTGLQAARRLQESGTLFAYMTLTNDHQPVTESGHDRTLAWERSEASRSAAGVFIGPPGRNMLEGPRKAIFCELSEGLAKRMGDPWQRFAPPCVTRDYSPGASNSGEEYGELLRAAPPIVKAREYEHLAGPPRWLTRKVATKRVAAAGGFMYPLSHEKALKQNLTIMHKHGPLLLRYVDPPLLQQAKHLGTPVRTRVEVRMFGMVQWEPLRIWTSRYGFFRGGTPWMNYSAQDDFGSANGPMWNVNRGVEAKCEDSPPGNPPPWRDPATYGACRGRGARASRKCCVCMTVADVIDHEHDEKGFATSGTLRRLDHVAAAAGLDVRRVWQSADEALIRQFVAEQRRFQAESKGAPLSRWATLFSADVGFAADGRAYLYENLLMPNWKRPGYYWHEAVDRADAIGIYSGQMLAMAPLLMAPEADMFHAQLLAPLGLAETAKKEASDFLRTQGLASFLGFRRTWPTPPRAPAHSLDAVADERDVTFARMLNQHRLLLGGMDVLSAERANSDAWGGTSANPAERSAPRWPVGRGVLWSTPSGPGRGNKCDDTPRILESWAEEARARARTAA